MFNVLIAVSLFYVFILFVVAFGAEKLTNSGRARWLRSPLVYTLSLSIYCTAWTFYGAVGYAARSGLEYLTIYIGPTLIMLGWWWILRKMIRVGRSQGVTSIADLLSSRFGKSNSVAVLVTIMAVVGTTPYIALQLQSVTLSLSVFASYDSQTSVFMDNSRAAFWLAIGLALFTILFGTRSLNANERHHGVVMAIALEAVVKLLALIAVGIFVVWGISGGISNVINEIDSSTIGHWDVDNSRWVALTFLSAAAFICLPRMFQVLVVENEDEDHLRTASWAFPIYLLLISLFVVPIAVVGLNMMPENSNPDFFVLSIPLAMGRDNLAIFSFLGGFSSATSMVIVASLAVATMVSNHIVMPLFLRWSSGKASGFGDVRFVVLTSRRISIGVILLLGYLYFELSGGGAALAAIGLVSFTGVAQILPSLLGGLFWRGATRSGAIAGLISGFSVWIYVSFLPSLGDGIVFSSSFIKEGPFGLDWLRQQALFGIEGLDPLVHAIFWSISLNSFFFFFVSILSFPRPIERLQGAQIVNVFQYEPSPQAWTAQKAQAEDLMVMCQRIMGVQQAKNLFNEEVIRQGSSSDLPEPVPDFLNRLEKELAGTVGTATAHAMISQIVGGSSISVQDLMAVADETVQIREYSQRLEQQSEQISRTARQLRIANEQLTKLSVQKDVFLSQVSHELRTPMTSILAFSEILKDEKKLSDQALKKYSDIIHAESHRLTRLLDDLLDLSVLENGQVSLNIQSVNLKSMIDKAISTVQAGNKEDKLTVKTEFSTRKRKIETDVDRLGQVFLNLVTNASKYCDAKKPTLKILIGFDKENYTVDFIDNGSGISKTDQQQIFEKFSRFGSQKSGSAGLGLAICREILKRLKGYIYYLPDKQGAAFRVVVPSRIYSE